MKADYTQENNPQGRESHALKITIESTLIWSLEKHACINNSVWVTGIIYKSSFKRFGKGQTGTERFFVHISIYIYFRLELG